MEIIFVLPTISIELFQLKRAPVAIFADEFRFAITGKVS
jgi:hypothetical protein